MAQYLEDFRAGTTVEIEIDYGSGCDITGWTFWFTLRSEFDDAAPVAQVSHTPGTDSRDDPLRGYCWITMPSDVTDSIEDGQYYYDIQVSHGGTPPKIFTILPPIEDYKDKITVRPRVTKVVS